MVLKIHNTLSGTKETFEPVDNNHVRIYACGPTVYNYAHIGNAQDRRCSRRYSEHDWGW